MSQKERYNIIIDWIDSCKTFEQLQNLIPVVKSQSFAIGEKLKMFHFMSIKSSQITINIYHDALKKLRQSL